jgi:hypothetical protein
MAPVSGTFPASSVSCAVNKIGPGQHFVHRDWRKPKTAICRSQQKTARGSYAPTAANSARFIVMLIVVAPNASGMADRNTIFSCIFTIYDTSEQEKVNKY